MSKRAWTKLIVILVAVILFVLLIWRNAGQTAELDFLVRKDDFPLIVLLVIVFALGLIAGIFTAFKVSADRERGK